METIFTYLYHANLSVTPACRDSSCNVPYRMKHCTRYDSERRLIQLEGL